MKNRFMLSALFVATAGFASATVITSTGFDTSNTPSFAIGDLNLQNNWSTLGGSWLVTNNVAHSGDHSVLIDTSLISVGWGWTPLGTAPNFLDSGVVVTTAWVRFNPFTGTEASAFGLEAWSNDGVDRFGTVTIHPSGASIKGGFDDAVVSNPSITASPDTWYKVMLVCDVAGKRVAGYVDGVLVGSTTNTTATATNVSDVDITAYAFGTYAANFGVDPTSGGFNTGFFDSYTAEQVPVGTIRGNVFLEDFNGAVAGRIAVIEVLNSGGSVLETVNAPLAANGDFEFTTAQRGALSLGVKSSHWLRKVISIGTVTDLGVFNANTSLTNGDCDDDNEVGPGDFASLTLAFGSALGDANYTDGADLDGDEEVGPSDFSILSGNFGDSGD